MRLIDADALTESKFKNPISYNAFKNLVQRQPTVDPKKRGYWLQKDEADPPKCSICGRQDFNYAFSFYCPHCGARMEIGDEE